MPRKAITPELADGVLAPDGRALSPQQDAFALEYVTNGGVGTEAAISAGYANASAHQAAHRLLRNPLVQQRILKLTLQRIGLLAPQALAQVAELSTGSKSDYVKLQAAQDLLDRAGFRPPEKVDHRVDANLTVTFDIAPRAKVIDG